MSYIILSAIVIAIAYLYEYLKNTNKTSKGIKWLFYILICFILCLFAGLRSKYNDTGAYIRDFFNTPKNFNYLFSDEFSVSEVYIFKMWNYFIYNFISHNEHIYLFLSSIIFVCPSIYLIEKYSKKFTFSIVLFMFGGMYLFSLAGVKQAMATGVVLIGLSFLFKRKYWIYYLFCIIALGLHTYSLFFLILPFLGTEVLNKRTVFFGIGIVLIGLSLSSFMNVITAITEFLGKNITEEEIEEGGVNIFRAIVFLVPLILTIFSGKKLRNITIPEKIIIKVGALSSIFMILALFGNPILFGRIPQYFLIGIVIALPLLIEKLFNKQDHRIIMGIAVICYVFFGIYGLYADGAFTKDIFNLVWF